ncbi:hypothetical protein [Paenibacillus sp. FSL R7-0337]|uniref:hypothetical protein n=1 Tax=Paenibacillus sp. FSL R7-0337 TaxID=1926588 RepID=UPI00096D1828|nr:hypothetical protein [Paenibacillus sp. FSL R7-0337]OMF84032.1 hypothetical protein BK147_33565 [Paenibacillus sp. FSL R7-0337]
MKHRIRTQIWLYVRRNPQLISTLGNLLIATFLDVLVRIGALGKAAKRSFSHLEGKMWEYLLGVDISGPMGAGAAGSEPERRRREGDVRQPRPGNNGQHYGGIRHRDS